MTARLVVSDAARADVRDVLIDRYLIYYEADSGGQSVRVLRILHGSRNITQELILKGRE
jgi:plasmid stabilization system protein ParE